MVDKGRSLSVEESEPIALSALQHAVYCMRQAALIHIERAWADNRLTAEGHVLHSVVDKGGARKIRFVRRVMSLPLASKRLNIAGIADVVEFIRDEKGEEIAFPLEYKRGKPKQHRADDVQLCAQALCLEEMTGQHVPAGALYYAQTKRRVVVPFDTDLREQTEATIGEFSAVLASGKTPPPTTRKERCRSCSLIEICRPHIVARPVASWRRNLVDRLQTDSGAP